MAATSGSAGAKSTASCSFKARGARVAFTVTKPFRNFFTHMWGGLSSAGTAPVLAAQIQFQAVLISCLTAVIRLHSSARGSHTPTHT